jgi:hypothetical protein
MFPKLLGAASIVMDHEGAKKTLIPEVTYVAAN